MEVLDNGGYVCYDFSTDSKILGVIRDLKANYGSLEELYRRSSGEKDLEKRLQDFKGIGPVTTEIFLRELRGIWDVSPEISDKAWRVARYLDIDLNEFDGRKLARVESALIRLYLTCCRRRDCRKCLLNEHCTQEMSLAFASKGGRILDAPLSLVLLVAETSDLICFRFGFLPSWV